MRRFFVELSYKGTRYHGWQIQKNAHTVQEVLDQALSMVFRQSIETVGCGRTDTGVHARKFYAHFDVHETPQGMDLEHMVYRLNSVLPADIGIYALHPVKADAHARFDALSRSYAYYMHFKKDPFLSDFSWQVRKWPDIALMNTAAEIIRTYTDFSCFSKAHTQVYTNNCILYHAYWTLQEDHSLVFHISANRFLRNMVRAIVGTLLDVGYGVYPAERIHTILESKDRANAGTSVPARGLFLTNIIYPYLNSGGAHG